MSGRPAWAAGLGALVALAWLGNALYAFGTPGGALKFWSPGLAALALIVFLVVHGARCHGGGGVLRFVLVVFAIAWLFESVSILTGFPFGRYHYTELMAPFVGHVPVFVMPAYCVIGYVCWSMARILLGLREPGGEAAGRFALPAVAAVLMVVWDLSMDPLRATVEGRWVWIGGGSYYGVPLANFVGWFIVTWAMFQCFALIEARRGAVARGPDPPGFWAAVPLMYLSFAVEYLLNVPLHGGSGGADAAIYAEIGAIAAVTMVPAAGACLHRLHRDRHGERGRSRDGGGAGDGDGGGRSVEA